MAIELLLWLASLMSEKAGLILTNRYGESRFIDDAIFGIRPNPRFAEHDEWGFRNRKVPTHVDIVTMGDSQTYGVNAPPEGAWPSLLAKQLNKTVYNLSFGTYSPPHYLYLLNKAQSLKPALVITAVYFGNDIWDAAYLIYGKQSIPGYHFYINQNPGMVAVMQMSYERVVSQSQEKAKILESGFNNAIPNIQKGIDIRVIIRRHSMLYGVLRLIRHRVKSEKSLKAYFEDAKKVNTVHWNQLCDYAMKNKNIYCFNSGSVRTVFDPRFRVMNKKITEAGLHIISFSLAEIDHRLKKRQISHLVVLIPTKEYVYKNIVPVKIKHKKLFSDLIFYEMANLARLKAYLDVEGIHYFDVSPALEKAAREQKQIYPYSSQSHPNIIGYSIIAHAIGKEILRLHGKKR